MSHPDKQRGPVGTASWRMPAERTCGRRSGTPPPGRLDDHPLLIFSGDCNGISADERSRAVVRLSRNLHQTTGSPHHRTEPPTDQLIKPWSAVSWPGARIKAPQERTEWEQRSSNSSGNGIQNGSPTSPGCASELALSREVGRRPKESSYRSQVSRTTPSTCPSCDRTFRLLGQTGRENGCPSHSRPTGARSETLRGTIRVPEKTIMRRRCSGPYKRHATGQEPGNRHGSGTHGRQVSLRQRQPSSV